MTGRRHFVPVNQRGAKKVLDDRPAKKRKEAAYVEAYPVKDYFHGYIYCTKKISVLLPEEWVTALERMYPGISPAKAIKKHIILTISPEKGL